MYVIMRGFVLHDWSVNMRRRRQDTTYGHMSEGRIENGLNATPLARYKQPNDSTYEEGRRRWGRALGGRGWALSKNRVGAEYRAGKIFIECGEARLFLVC